MLRVCMRISGRDEASEKRPAGRPVKRSSPDPKRTGEVSPQATEEVNGLPPGA